MRKKIAVFLAAGMLLTAVPTATSCAKAPEEAPTESQKETTAATTTTQTEETTTETETQKEYSSDIDSQMDIIVKSYDFIWSDYFVYSEVYPGTSFAITDLNHNGRLEVIVSSIQGSGAFSLTNFYEISEDYSNSTMQHIDKVLAGSTQKYISLGELRKMPIVMPSAQQITDFNAVVKPIICQIINLTNECKRLIELRDTLLPRLMSGELDVSEIEL